MKSFTKSLTLDTQFSHLYRPLVRNLLIVVLLSIGLVAAVLLYFDKRQVDSLSRQLIEKSAQTTGQKLDRLFNGAATGLELAQRQIESLKLSGDDWQIPLFAALEPFLAQFDFLDSINLADESGSEYVLIKQEEEILTRHVDANTPSVAHWQRRNGRQIVEQWTRQINVSPKERPWYQGALGRGPGEHYWTDPYAFLTTKEPGVSVSSRRPISYGNGEYVVAFNITLTDVYQHTTRLRPSENGMTVIFDQNGKKCLGLPPSPRFDDDEELLSSLLQPVSELGLPAIDAAVAEWEANDKSEIIFPFRTPDQEAWWSGFTALQLDDQRTVWSMVLVPEKDLLGSLHNLRNLSLAGIGIIGFLIAALVFFTSMRSIRNQMRSAVDLAERRLGQYKLKQKIGEGGNGTVYRAQHALLRRPTAVKIMNPDFARSGAARERFEQEVQMTSNLSHPNTIVIYDYGRCPDGTLYYAMELLDGNTLEHLVRLTGPLVPGRVIHILEQMTGSLTEAHKKKLIHRDIKPSNVMLCKHGGLYDVVKVVDFGLVKEIAQTDGNLTQANVLIGTPLCMAPEIISEPGRASPQSDIYALGVVGYLLLTARNVFDGDSAVEICAKHLNEAPVSPSERVGLQVPADLEAIILACLEKDPSRRPADAASLRASLLECQDANVWSQENALEWWRTHEAVFTGASSAETATPLSNTELLVDLDQRLISTGSNAVTN
ncbi:MAG: protein kinase domain-containing protein [bacterium]